MVDLRPEAKSLKQLAARQAASPLMLAQRKLAERAGQMDAELRQRARREGAEDRGLPVAQLSTGTLTATTAKHPRSVAENPENDPYYLGFQMDVSLTTDTPFQYNTLQEHFELTQYVRDEYEFWTGSESEDEVDKQALSVWHRDSYGRDDDKGDWHSEGGRTSWRDTPGWTTANKRVTGGYLLQKYAVEFYFTIANGKGPVFHRTEPIRLEAEGNDDNHIGYTTANINEAIDYPD
jgi:hypothetical protein